MMKNIKETIGLEKNPKQTRVVVAMSGGVDSSVTAALFKEAGNDFVGLTMQLYDQGEMVQKKKACCAGQDIYDAKRVAQQIGIPHYVLDYESKFKAQVMEDFANAYLRGETPIPCVRCNQTVKFKDMFQMAKSLGGEALATGHYVRWQKGSGGPELHRGVDPNRDQSYFLFATTKDQLAFLRFPLGGMSKGETRDHARRLGLDTSEKPDSQDICFVPDGNYVNIVNRLRPGALEAGEIVHLDGRVLGRHEGIIHFTVGQRRGLGSAQAPVTPLYVIKLDPISHRVIVGPREALQCRKMILKDVNWLGDDKGLEKKEITLKYRSSQTPLPASLIRLDGSSAEVNLDTPEYGVSPGQACVFYDGTRVLGGGWIEKAPLAHEHH